MSVSAYQSHFFNHRLKHPNNQKTKQGRCLPDARSGGEWGLATAAHQRRFQSQLHDHIRQLQVTVGFCRVHAFVSGFRQLFRVLLWKMMRSTHLRSYSLLVFLSYRRCSHVVADASAQQQTFIHCHCRCRYCHDFVKTGTSSPSGPSDSTGASCCWDTAGLVLLLLHHPQQQPQHLQLVPAAAAARQQRRPTVQCWRPARPGCAPSAIL